jgi:hypothetical protein
MKSLNKYALLMALLLPFNVNGDVGPRTTILGDLGVDTKAENPAKEIPSIP